MPAGLVSECLHDSSDHAAHMHTVAIVIIGQAAHANDAQPRKCNDSTIVIITRTHKEHGGAQQPRIISQLNAILMDRRSSGRAHDRRNGHNSKFKPKPLSKLTGTV